MADEPKPTVGKDWRKRREEGEIVPLPSGKLVRGRTVRPVHILELGADVPDTLTALALKIFYGTATNDDVLNFIKPASEDADTAKAIAKSVAIVVRAFLLEPRVVDEPLADDEITIDDIEPQDQVAIFDMAFAGAEALRKFFRASEQDGNLQAVAEGENVSQAA